MSRWISCVRPVWRPETASRWPRVVVAAGSMLYSAVSQPRCDLRSHCGTPSTTTAVQITCVSPICMSTEPSACLTTLGVILTVRSSSAMRPVLKRRTSLVSGSDGAVTRAGGSRPQGQTTPLRTTFRTMIPRVNMTAASPAVTASTLYQ